jgi:hypothetical protein
MLQMISIIEELERFDIPFEWASGEEIKVCCPYHGDNRPSAFINVHKQAFYCQVCNAKGDFVKFLSGSVGSDQAELQRELNVRYGIKIEKVIDPRSVDDFHSRINEAGGLLVELYKRGITDDIIRKRRIGFGHNRITIPIFNPRGDCVNIRYYLPGASYENKFQNTKGHGDLRLYPEDQLQFNEIVLCGGELKALAIIEELNQHGIGAISPTGGESNWSAELNLRFKGKTVYICFDIDETGIRAAKERAAQVREVADWVGILRLPLDISKYPKGDVNDYVGVEKKKVFPLLEKVPKYEPASENSSLDFEEVHDVNLDEAFSAKYAAKRVKVQCVISSMDISPYLLPKKLYISCTKDTKYCELCPIKYKELDNGKPFEISPESPTFLGMVGEKDIEPSLKEAFHIPQRCYAVSFQPIEFHTVEDCRLSPTMDLMDRNDERNLVAGVVLADKLELNETYEMTGKVFPHPKTQQSTFLISTSRKSDDSLSRFSIENPGELEIFRPESELQIAEKLDEIYEDLEANVTRIFSRRPLHLAVDLCYHSPLFIPFDGRAWKGWTEVCILGDSSQGKTETAMTLQQHYKLGAKLECKGASVAGLLGGLQQFNKRWFVTWGVIPSHDKRLVILEELKGAETEVIAKLTDMRSSGFAELAKIEKRKTRARTRLLALSNPRSNRPLDTYNYGTDAIVELIGAMEDIRRFDLFQIVERKQVDIRKLQAYRPDIPHRFTSELCNKLVLWSWTIRDIEWENEREILKKAIELSEEFTDAVPILDRGSARFKLARLSAALAARLFYTKNDGKTLYVPTAVVNYIVDYLRNSYSADAFGYDTYSKSVAAAETLKDRDILIRTLQATPHPKELVGMLLSSNQIDAKLLSDVTSYDYGEGHELLSSLIRLNALRRSGNNYYKTSEFTSTLKHLASSAEVLRPDYIDEEF